MKQTGCIKLMPEVYNYSCLPASLQVLLSNFQPPLHIPEDYNVSCNLTLPSSLLPGRELVVTMFRISPAEANPRAVWEEMGRPLSLSEQQK